MLAGLLYRWVYSLEDSQVALLEELLECTRPAYGFGHSKNMEGLLQVVKSFVSPCTKELPVLEGDVEAKQRVIKVLVNELKQQQKVDPSLLKLILAALKLDPLYKSFSVSNAKGTRILSTGILAIDDLIEGGLVDGEWLELCGSPGTGKSRICYSTIKQFLRNFPRGNVALFDTTGSGLYFTELADVDPDRVFVCCSVDLFTLAADLESLRLRLDGSAWLIVVDNVGSVMTALSNERRTWFDASEALGRTIKRLISPNRFLLVVNHVSHDTSAVEKKKPYMAKHWGMFSDTQLVLTPVDAAVEASVFKSNRIPNGASANFVLY